MSSFVRRVKTASGATAVQIVHKRGRDVVGIDHIGSAHDDAALALLGIPNETRTADGPAAQGGGEDPSSDLLVEALRRPRVASRLPLAA